MWTWIRACARRRFDLRHSDTKKTTEFRGFFAWDCVELSSTTSLSYIALSLMNCEAELRLRFIRNRAELGGARAWT